MERRDVTFGSAMGVDLILECKYCGHPKIKKGQWFVAAVKAPGFGDRRKAMLEDIAVLSRHDDR